MTSEASSRHESERRAEIEDTAAEWIARHYQGLTLAQTEDFRRWLAADRRHAAAFAELEETWRLLDRVRPAASTIPTRDRRPDPDALAPRHARRVFWRSVFRPALAAAAALAIVCVGWWRTSAPAPWFTREVATEIGAWQQLALPDGSMIQLNTDTVVRVAYTKTERRIRLERGEAYFTVAKNSARPFLVEIGGVTVRAVGTAFNVRRLPATVDVVVTEGRVSVDDSDRDPPLIRARHRAESPLLQAGERAIVSMAPSSVEAKRVEVMALDPGELQRALAWQERRLEFVAAPLEEIVAEFNRYHRSKLVIEGATLATQRFGGSFRAEQPEIFVRLLESRFGIAVERRAEETVLRPAP